MKQIVKISTACALVVSVIVLSCKKDSRINSENQTPTRTSMNGMMDKSSALSILGIGVDKDMLVFQNNDQVKNTIDELNRQYEQNELDFITTYPELNGEELMNKEAEIGYNDNQVFLDFEKQFKFTSLRQSIQNDYNKLISSVSNLIDIDLLKDPRDHFVVEEAVRSILNQYSEVKIGNDIIKVFDGGFIRIIGGDRTKLAAIRSNLNNATKLVGIDIEGDVLSPAGLAFADCIGAQKVREKIYNSGNGSERIKCVVAIQTFPWDRYVIAKTANETKKRNRWKDTRAGTTTRVWGSVAAIVFNQETQKNEPDCNTELVFNTENGLKAQEANVKRKEHKISVQTKTKSGWVKGFHQQGNNTIGITGKTVLEF